MALYHKWDVKKGSANVLQFFSFISDSLGGVHEEVPVFVTFVISMKKQGRGIIMAVP